MIWNIPSGDVATGGTMLLRLEHRLLPVIESAVLSGEGALLTARPVSVTPARPIGGAEARKEYLVRLESLLAFLRFCGLGIAAADVEAIGHQSRDVRRPALQGPPVPLWRAVASTTVLSAVATRISDSAASSDPVTRDVLDLAARGPISFSGCDLFSRWRPGSGWSIAVLRDCAGLVTPAEFEQGTPAEGEVPVAGVGDGGALAVRGAVRRGFGSSDFVELRRPSGLSGASIIDSLMAGAIGRRVEALLQDPGLSTSSTPARGLALVGFGLEDWDARSLQFWNRLSALFPRVRRYEVRAKLPPPWTPCRVLRPRLGAGEVGSLVFFPFESLAGARRAWEDLAEHSAGEIRRFVERFESLRFTGELPDTTSLPLPRVRRDPVLMAAAVLGAAFTLDELSIATGRPLEAVTMAVESLLDGGFLRASHPGQFQLTEPAVGEALRKELRPKEKEGIRQRVEESALETSRKLAICLQLDEDVLPMARQRFRELFDSGAESKALELLEAAPASDSVLGSAWRALFLWDENHESERARAAAALFDGTLDSVEPARLESLGRLLARYRHDGKALAITILLPSHRQRLYRLRCLLWGKRNAEALEFATAEDGAGAASGGEGEAEWDLAVCDALSRCGRYEDARTRLDRLVATGVLAASRDRSVEFAFTSGYLYSDLGEHARAEGCFRLAKTAARSERAKARATLDVGVSLLHLGRFPEARTEIEESMALFARFRDSDSYFSALANRGELSFKEGRFTEARRDLERVLEHDSSAGREFQWLFSVPTLMAILQSELDLESGGSLFARASEIAKANPGHQAWREILIVEARRCLLRRQPRKAREFLVEAGKLPDNRMQNEAARERLFLSSLIDGGNSATVRRELQQVSLPANEKVLLEAELALKAGAVPSSCDGGAPPARRTVSQAAERADRLWEWVLRFPEVFETPSALPLLRDGATAAEAAQRSALVRFFESRCRVVEHLPQTAREEVSLPVATGRVAEDHGTRRAFEEARRVASSSMPVLILGETGTGKEILAREIHAASGRPGQLVPLNVAALTETLLESELFGHARGAFTGAERERAGLVETAEGGTLFLDEIGELPTMLQAKLLRLLQEKEYRRLGETRTRTANFRLVCATHRDLPARVAEGRFRQDFYYRIAGVTIELPPLRSRPRDLALLMERALSPRFRLTPRAEAALRTHPWPGNIRELLSVIESAKLLASPGGLIDVAHLPPRLLPAPTKSEASPREEGRRYFQAIENAKRREILAALSEAGGNRSAAARILGLSRQALLYEMKKLGITGK